MMLSLVFARTRRGHFLIVLAALLPFGLASCNRNKFPSYPAEYHEYAYVTDGASDTVAVLDLVYLRQDRVIQVGRHPSGLTVNPVRNEVYSVNTDSDSISVIDATQNKVTATIGVHAKPYFMDVSGDGKRGYVANSGANTVSVLDLMRRRELAATATGEGPGMAKLSPDNRAVVVSNRLAGSVSVYTVTTSETTPLVFRGAYNGCPGATDVAVSANSLSDPTSGSKAFIACSGSNKIMVLWLGAAPDSWGGRQDSSLQQDHLLAILDVGTTPTHLALKPDGGEIFATNFNSDSVSEISTWTNEVSGTYIIGSKPSRGLISHDNSTLWVSNFGADTVSLYSIDDGKLISAVRTGSGPDALALSKDEHLLLIANSRSGDVAVIRTQSKSGTPELVTMLPAGARPNDLVIKAFNAQ